MYGLSRDPLGGNSPVYIKEANPFLVCEKAELFFLGVELVTQRIRSQPYYN